MKLALMPTDLAPETELRSMGFEAMQLFFESGTDPDEKKDPEPAAVKARMQKNGLALAAMTQHVDLVGPRGCLEADVKRSIRCVQKTAAMKGLFGDNEKPILIWHPSEYPAGRDTDDKAVFEGLCKALGAVCKAAERENVDVAVEITRAGSVGSAETFLRIKDRVGSPALRACVDGANFMPDRTPLERAVRMLGPDIVIAHAKDSRFRENGEVAAYGPVGSGKLDYAAYMRCLREYSHPAYCVLEYYNTRDELLRARDIVRECLK